MYVGVTPNDRYEYIIVSDPIGVIESSTPDLRE